MRIDHLRHEFVEFIPGELEAGVLYVSIPYATAIHLCCSGCGERVVTPLSPIDWQLTFDGESVSLHPSIGNWSLQCQSHYWIVKNQVRWAAKWTKAEIDAKRKRERSEREAHYDTPSEQVAHDEQAPAASNGLLARLRRFFK